MPSPWIGVKVSVNVSKFTPLLPGYVGVAVRPDTLTHCPLCRTCTVSVVNQPPSAKCLPSWNTTRANVLAVEKVYPTQSSAAALAPSQLSYCWAELVLPTAGLTPSRMRLRGPPPPIGAVTLAMGVPVGARFPFPAVAYRS